MKLTAIAAAVLAGATILTGAAQATPIYAYQTVVYPSHEPPEPGPAPEVEYGPHNPRPADPADPVCTDDPQAALHGIALCDDCGGKDRGRGKGKRGHGGKKSHGGKHASKDKSHGDRDGHEGNNESSSSAH